MVSECDYETYGQDFPGHFKQSCLEEEAEQMTTLYTCSPGHPREQ